VPDEPPVDVPVPGENSTSAPSPSEAPAPEPAPGPGPGDNTSVPVPPGDNNTEPTTPPETVAPIPTSVPVTPGDNGTNSTAPPEPVDDLDSFSCSNRFHLLELADEDKRVVCGASATPEACLLNVLYLVKDPTAENVSGFANDSIIDRYCAIAAACSTVYQYDGVSTLDSPDGFMVDAYQLVLVEPQRGGSSWTLHSTEFLPLHMVCVVCSSASPVSAHSTQLTGCHQQVNCDAISSCSILLPSIIVSAQAGYSALR